MLESTVVSRQELLSINDRCHPTPKSGLHPNQRAQVWLRVSGGYLSRIRVDLFSSCFLFIKETLAFLFVIWGMNTREPTVMWKLFSTESNRILMRKTTETSREFWCLDAQIWIQLWDPKMGKNENDQTWKSKVTWWEHGPYHWYDEQRGETLSYCACRRLSLQIQSKLSAYTARSEPEKRQEKANLWWLHQNIVWRHCSEWNVLYWWWAKNHIWQYKRKSAAVLMERTHQLPKRGYFNGSSRC